MKSASVWRPLIGRNWHSTSYGLLKRINMSKPAPQIITPAQGGRYGDACKCSGKLLGAPGFDRFLELVVAVNVTRTFARIDFVERRQLRVEPTRQLLVVGICGFIGFIDQHKVD